MSISSSLNAGVAGLNANATRLATISDNIANSSTYGYKRASADFESMVISQARGPVISGSIQPSRRADLRAEVQAVVTSKTVTNTSLNEGSVTLLLVANTAQLTVQTNSRTQFEDKTGAVDSLRLADIGTGDYLEIRGFIDDGGVVVASEVRRDDATGEDVILQGPVNSSSPDTSVTILGVTFNTQVGVTEFENSLDLPISSSAFYGALSAGTVVKIKDDNVPGDGIADEASLED